MPSRRTLTSLVAAAPALLLILLTLFPVAAIDAHTDNANKLASSTSTSSTFSSSSSLPLRRHQRRRPFLGPRSITGVRRDLALYNMESASSPPLPPSLSPSHPTDLLSRCRELWRDATLDHFSGWRPRRSADVDAKSEEDDFGKKRKHHRHHSRTLKTFKQRYFVCDDQWAGPGSPVFFYFGNEADVTLYLNATGLMWQSAPAFGAALVFAEHR
jgi:hypothetical protein